MLTIQEIVKKSGGQFTFGLIDNIAGISDLRDALYAKVLAIPWVDAAAIREVLAQAPEGAVWSPNYAISAPAWHSGKFSEADINRVGMPSFVHDLGHAAKWNELNDWWRENIMPVLQANTKAQSYLLQQAVDNAAFWETLYQVDKAIAELPGKVAGAASGLVTGVFSKLMPVLLLGGALFAAYIYSRSQYRKAN